MLSLLFRFRRLLSLLLCIFVSLWLKNSDLKERMRIAHGVQVTVLSPVQFVVTKVTALGNILRENRNLREENVRLRTENDMLREAKKDNEGFRQMLDYKASSTFSLISTEVVAARRDLLAQNLIINSGTLRGVKKDMPLIALQGVIGKVIEAYPFHSNIQLVSDPSSHTGILFPRTGVTGILECKNGYTPIVNVFIHNKIQPGDSVITSGLGGIFPKGLYVGKVRRVIPGDDMFNQAEIELNNGLDNVSHAFLLNIHTQWAPFSAPDSAVKK